MRRINLVHAKPRYLPLLRRSVATDWNDWLGFAESLVEWVFAEGLLGHVTVRDPEHADLLWVNPVGVSFRQMARAFCSRVSEFVGVARIRLAFMPNTLGRNHGYRRRFS